MRAREIMTRSVLTVLPTVTVGKASDMLTYRGFSALPVVDEDGALIGIVTEADLIRNRFPDEASADQTEPAVAPGRTVGEVMTTPVVGVSHDADISVLARVMLSDRRRCVPIVDGIKLVGVVTRRDVVRVLSRSDAEIAADVRKHLQFLGGQARWSVQVTDGEVVVRDQFDEASDRTVAQVLAEAVPGVIRVTVRADQQAATTS
ncbi:MAG TPA: CBS domain-containing protein [Nakamurella sp.]|jgi:CBS domain-containing protein|nr:CBS domain-containing protein [Nakamurella sp.]